MLHEKETAFKKWVQESRLENWIHIPQERLQLSDSQKMSLYNLLSKVYRFIDCVYKPSSAKNPEMVFTKGHELLLQITQTLDTIDRMKTPYISKELHSLKESIEELFPKKNFTLTPSAEQRISFSTVTDSSTWDLK